MPATYSKPVSIPRWADDGLNTVEPSAAKKDEGWVFQEIPPSSWENWRTHLIGEWFKWIDERLADGVDENELVVRDPGDASSAVRIGSGLVTFDKPLNAPSLLQLAVAGTTEFQVGVGYARTQGEHRFADSAFLASMLLGKPTITFDSGNDLLEYDRGTNRWSFKTAGAERFGVGANGAEFGDPNFYLQFDGTNPRVYFDSGDYLLYTRSANRLSLYVGGAAAFYYEGSVLRLGAGGSASTLQLTGGSSVSAVASALTLTGPRLDVEIGSRLMLQIISSVGSRVVSLNSKFIFNTGELVGDPATLTMSAVDSSLGTTATAIPIMYGSRIYSRFDSADPGAGNGRIAALVGRNATLVQCEWQPNGAAYTLSTALWNVSAFSRTGVGAYRVDFYRDINEYACILCDFSWEPGAVIPGSDNYEVRAQRISFSQINVTTYTKASNNVLTAADLPLGVRISLVVIGRPFNYVYA